MNDNASKYPIEPDDSQSRLMPVVRHSPVESFQTQPIEPTGPVYNSPITTPPFKTEFEQGTPVIHPPVAPLPAEMVKETKSPKPKNRKLKFWVISFVALLILLIFFTPFRVTLLVLGIDRPPKDTWIGRSDTMILTTLPPVLPQVSMLSIPRDLWVTIPNQYDNRVNTAHYFAELETPNTGMQAARQVVEVNFRINVDYVVRIKFDGFIDVIDAMGGVTVDLPSDMSGLTAGKNHLDGTQALAFVRDRTGSDDFFRQQRGQLLIVSAIKQMLNPLKWPRIPAVLVAASKAIETDLPLPLWPRMAYGMLFSAVNGFDSHTFDRNAVTPWVTDEGAQVLLPNWELINPMMEEIFK